MNAKIRIVGTDNGLTGATRVCEAARSAGSARQSVEIGGIGAFRDWHGSGDESDFVVNMFARAFEDSPSRFLCERVRIFLRKHVGGLRRRELLAVNVEELERSDLDVSAGLRLARLDIVSSKVALAVNIGVEILGSLEGSSDGVKRRPIATVVGRPLGDLPIHVPNRKRRVVPTVMMLADLEVSDGELISFAIFHIAI